MVSREELKVEAGKLNGKPQYELYWVYSYKPSRQYYEKEGFYYGQPKLLNIKRISEAIATKQGLFVLVEIEWMVDDLQSWTKDKAFHVARTLRRSQSSASQPFEKKIHFQYLPGINSWQVWEPEG